MGVPLPPPEVSEPAASGLGGVPRGLQAPRQPGSRVQPPGAYVSSLSSLLLARGPRPLALPPAAPRPPVPPPQLADDGLPSSPPPLAPASESDSDWDDDMPPLLVSSPLANRHGGGLDDLLPDLCPWPGLLEEEPLLAPAPPGLERAQRHPNVFLDSEGLFTSNLGLGRFPASFGFARLNVIPSATANLFSPLPGLAARTQGPAGSSDALPQQAGAPGASGPARQQQQQAPAQQTLEAELAGMAGRLAELVRVNRGSAHPGVVAGLQDAAKLLQGLASGTALGPPA